MNDKNYKICFKCKTSKPIIGFFKNSQTLDGFHSWCKSCCTEGNIKSRAKANSQIGTRAKIFLRNAAKAAVKRNQEFSLTANDIVEMWDLQLAICPYSGREMTLEAGKLETVSIERIDSGIGYTRENTILVCNAVNRMKSDFSLQEFYDLCSDVARFIGDKDLQLAVEAKK
jgi:hypothetical protein